jgi:GNAT superfamily N-acetyltransferase
LNQMEGISHTQLRIASLREENELASFCSNSDELNDFLKSDALKAQNDLISRTYLCFWKESLAGFVTLTTDTIGYNLVEQCDGIEGYVYQKYPAIKIARLAVDDGYKRRGIGQNLLLWAVGKAYEISKQIGCRYITVDAKRESINFYLKYEFKIIKKHKDRDFPPMYFNLYSADKKDKQKEPVANEENTSDEEKLKVVGMEALNKALGLESALRFLALYHSGPTDYVDVSKRLYENQSVEDIFKRAKEHWRS